MKRSFNKKSLAAVLLCAGIGGGFALAAPKTGTPANVVMVQEEGKPARKCTLLASTKQPDGSMVHTVRALDNGELINVRDDKPEATAAAAKAVAEIAAAPKPAGTSVKKMIEERKTVADTKVAAKGMAPATAIESDPLLRGPADMPKFKEEAIVSNVNAAAASPSKTTVVSEQAPARGLFNRTKQEPAKVPSTMTAKSVVVETPSKVFVPALPTTVGKPATASIGEPMRMPAPVAAPAIPVMPVYVPAPQAVPVSVPRELHLRNTLKDSLQPSEREMAAMELTGCPEAKGPAVRSALLTAAKEDPAGTVRAACLKCLAKVAPGDGIAAAAAAKEDPDARVRNEAVEILEKAKK